MKWLWVAIAIYICVLGAVAVMRHYNFQTQAWDLGIFDQIMWNTLRGRIMQNSIEPIANHFATHMSPFLFLLLPGYAVFPSPYFLLIIQVIALALGAWPLYLAAKNALKNRLNALILSLAYLLYPPLHLVNFFDFHPVAFLVPAMLAAFYFSEEKRWGWMSVFLALAASTQEDAVLIVAFFGLYLALKKEYKIGLFTFLLSILYFLFSIKIVMPYFGGGLLRLDRYIQLGGSFSEILKNLFAHPSFFINTIWEWPKFVYLFWLFLPVAFLPLFAPHELILLVPGLAQNLLTNYGPQFSGAFQYDSALIAAVFIGALYAFQNFERRLPYLKWIFIAFAVLGFFLRSPLSPANFPAELFKSNPHWENLRQMLKDVPEGISVAAHAELVPHLTHREKIYMLGFEPTLQPDILLVDGADFFGFPSPETFQAHIQQYASSGKYSAEIIKNRYYILKRK